MGRLPRRGTWTWPLPTRAGKEKCGVKALVRRERKAQNQYKAGQTDRSRRRLCAV